jgi:hypothetical protein
MRAVCRHDYPAVMPIAGWRGFVSPARNLGRAGRFSFDSCSAAFVGGHKRAMIMSAVLDASTSFDASMSNDRYFLVLGAAALDLWSNLPQGLQESLFERAVVLGHKSERDESLREQLAKFLHDNHPRTQHG